MGKWGACSSTIGLGSIEEKKTLDLIVDTTEHTWTKEFFNPSWFLEPPGKLLHMVTMVARVSHIDNC